MEWNDRQTTGKEDRLVSFASDWSMRNFRQKDFFRIFYRGWTFRQDRNEIFDSKRHFDPIGRPTDQSHSEVFTPFSFSVSVSLTTLLLLELVMPSDFLTRRRLIFTLLAIFLITLSLLFVAHVRTNIIQHVLSSSAINNDLPPLSEQKTSTCHLSEPFEVINPCDKCSSYETKFLPQICQATGYKDLVLCSKSNVKTYRSCPMPKTVQKRHFWIFESVVFLIALVSIAGVQSRQKILDKQMVEKIKRQIGENAE